MNSFITAAAVSLLPARSYLFKAPKGASQEHSVAATAVILSTHNNSLDQPPCKSAFGRRRHDHHHYGSAGFNDNVLLHFTCSAVCFLFVLPGAGGGRWPSTEFDNSFTINGHLLLMKSFISLYDMRLSSQRIHIFIYVCSKLSFSQGVGFIDTNNQSPFCGQFY